MSGRDDGASSGPGSRKPSPEGLGPPGFDPSRVCGCFRCTKERVAVDPGETMLGQPVALIRMFLCAWCGNKRCPHATDHRFACSGSNEPGQLGSSYGPAEIPAISMWQPWASLVFETDPAFHKGLETRSFRYPAKYDGQRIAIQAAASFPARHLVPADLHELATRAFDPLYRRTLPLGAYLGTVVLGGCHPSESLREHIGFADRVAGFWDDGRFGWSFDDPLTLQKPVPAKGKQGWWKAPAEIFAARAEGIAKEPRP